MIIPWAQEGHCLISHKMRTSMFDSLEPPPPPPYPPTPTPTPAKKEEEEGKIKVTVLSSHIRFISAGHAILPRINIYSNS